IQICSINSRQSDHTHKSSKLHLKISYTRSCRQTSPQYCALRPRTHARNLGLAGEELDRFSPWSMESSTMYPPNLVLGLNLPLNGGWHPHGDQGLLSTTLPETLPLRPRSRR
ncbi:unnamed protein product, partial [Meganyctiphanes norvegica]